MLAQHGALTSSISIVMCL